MLRAKCLLAGGWGAAEGAHTADRLASRATGPTPATAPGVRHRESPCLFSLSLSLTPLLSLRSGSTVDAGLVSLWLAPLSCCRRSCLECPGLLLMTFLSVFQIVSNKSIPRKRPREVALSTFHTRGSPVPFSSRVGLISVMLVGGWGEQGCLSDSLPHRLSSKPLSLPLVSQTRSGAVGAHCMGWPQKQYKEPTTDRSPCSPFPRQILGGRPVFLPPPPPSWCPLPLPRWSPCSWCHSDLKMPLGTLLFLLVGGGYAGID